MYLSFYSLSIFKIIVDTYSHEKKSLKLLAVKLHLFLILANVLYNKLPLLTYSKQQKLKKLRNLNDMNFIDKRNYYLYYIEKKQNTWCLSKPFYIKNIYKLKKNFQSNKFYYCFSESSVKLLVSEMELSGLKYVSFLINSVLL